MYNFAKSLAVVGSLAAGISVGPQTVNAFSGGVKSNIEETRYSAYTLVSGNPTSHTTDKVINLNGGNKAQKELIDLIKDFLHPLNKKTQTSILVEGHNLEGTKKTLANILKKAKIPRVSLYTYEDMVGENGETLSVISALTQAIEDGNTKVIIVTNKAGEDWGNHTEIGGVSIITLLIPDNGITCENTKYKEIGYCVTINK